MPEDLPRGMCHLEALSRSHSRKFLCRSARHCGRRPVFQGPLEMGVWCFHSIRRAEGVLHWGFRGRLHQLARLQAI